ncbi:MAG: exodeoxyribonuclease VII large subunit [Pseudomonadales bacterium]
MYSKANRNIAANTKSITVSELNRQTKSLLENSFLGLRVQGELSNLAKPSSGHWYFTLKDARAQVRCAMFRGNNRAVNFTPKEGDQITVQAKVSLYEGRGDYQLICDSMEQTGSGRLQLAFEQLKARLHREGLFDSSYKKQIPSIIGRLGVITSASGAAIHDITSVLKRRFPGLEITLYPSAVQGDGAANELVSALELAQRHEHCDVIIIGRGGGSLEDLWPFNEEKVARAIFSCRIPIISAVGHEIDYSIADLVADYRAPTPSAAAELVSPDQNNLRLHLDQLQRRLQLLTHNKVIQSQQRLEHIKRRLQSPQERLQIQRLHLKALEKRLSQQLENTLRRKRHALAMTRQQLSTNSPVITLQLKRDKLQLLREKLQHNMDNTRHAKLLRLRELVATLDGVSPLATLHRGYSITRNSSNEVIHHIDQLSVGQTVTTKLHQGSVESQVTALLPEETNA